MNIRILFIAILLILCGMGIMFGFSAYEYYKAIHADDPGIPVLKVEEGNAMIVRGDIAIDLSKNESYEIQVSDELETKSNSRAMVIWPDKSVTRLDSNTRIVINTIQVSESYDDIKISMSMKRGKIWSNIVHTLLGESYFETRLPSNDIVAAVRGTVFEINLDSGYIHAVNHNMQLTDISRKVLNLLPGEIVSSENIWIKKTKEVLDTTWNQWNTMTDVAYNTARTGFIKSQMQLISGAAKAGNIWDQFVRWVLSFFPSFDILSLGDITKITDTSGLANKSKELLIRYYQRYQGKDFTKERDTIRVALMQKFASDSTGISILNSLKGGAFWDSMDSDTILPGAQKLLNGSIESIRSDFMNLKNTINNPILSDELKSKIQKYLQ